ncbi:Hsp70 family protein, partial [Stieleria sp.]|uniref:Hsp70 family protein n=1 Tax=Stieleria sp. TaxID=2795976 RepID=UPI003566D217
MSEHNDTSTDPTATPPRFVVGIDLGTTNCAMCYVDTSRPDWQVETFRIPQWVDLGQLEKRETLPSFHYELTASEAGGQAGALPWQDASSKPTSCVGVFARDAGARHPGRRINSAKSWLSHDGVDRTADFLPWHGDADVPRMSPVAASSEYLRHLRGAWDDAFAEHPLHEQDVVITLPASFDEVARELTIKAAKQAGLKRVYLIEEPQAAFYAWIDGHRSDWQDLVRPGQLILVCDIGGGTTDLTLIRVRPAGQSNDQVQFHRVAVGRHLILGGDNMDLAVAKLAEAKLNETSGGTPPSASQWDRMV